MANENDNKSVMKVDSTTTLEQKQNKEYQEAVEKGFQGTKEEYLVFRDYT